jgi:CCR4-NOT transcriptional regulation complex NOT5 subunit
LRAAARASAIASGAPARNVDGSNPTSSATPATPKARPSIARAGRAVRVHSAPITAPQIGAVALRMDSSEADSVRAANANSRKGRAELNRPSTR